MTIMSGASFADTRLSIQHTESGKEPQNQTVMVRSGKVRMEYGTDDNTVLLYDQADNTFFAIQPDEKSYMEFDPEKTAEMMDQASQMQQQMMAKLQESLKDMPEGQREKMMMLMNRSGQAMPGLPEEPVRYESRAGSDSSGASPVIGWRSTRASGKCESFVSPSPPPWECLRATKKR